MPLDPIFNLYEIRDEETLRSENELRYRKHLEADAVEFSLRRERDSFSYYLEQKPHWKNDLHRHRFFEILLFVKGRGNYVSEKSRFIVKPGDVLFVNPSLRHTFFPLESSLARINISFDARKIAESGESETVIRAHHLFKPFFEGDLRLHIGDPGEWRRLLHHFFGLVHVDTTTTRLKAELSRSLLAAGLGFIYEAFQREVSQKSSSLRGGELFDLRERVIGRLDRKIYVSEIARELGLETRNFSAEFRRRHGMSFPDYLNVLRVEEARRLLAASNLPVTRIALETGFNNTAYFNRTFKRLTRLVPVEYRRRHGVK